MKHLLVPILGLFLATCNTTDPPPPTGEPLLRFAAIDASCTEVWLGVKLAAGVQPRVLTFMRDTQTILTTTLIGSDTVIVDEGLIPNSQYAYKLIRAAGMFTEERSASATTMDTTSSQWIFEEHVLGEVFSGQLYDVALVSDSVAYAVGSMYMRDSLGEPDLRQYNLAAWDGSTWQLMRAPFIGPCSAVDFPPLYGIWAISPSHILLTNGGAIVTYDGNSSSMDCRMNSLLTGAITKIFGTGPQNIYAVGNSGNIVHYSTGWRRETLPPQIPDTSNVYIADISGVPNSARVLGLVRGNNQNGTYLMDKPSSSRWHWNLIYDGSHAQLTPRVDSLSGHYTSLYIPEGIAFYVSTYLGVYRAPLWTKGEAKRLGSTLPGTPFRLRGNGHNDIVAVGSGGMIAHFNGVRWTNVTNPGSGSQTLYRSVAIHGNLLIAVGDRNARGYAVVGRR